MKTSKALFSLISLMTLFPFTVALAVEFCATPPNAGDWDIVDNGSSTIPMQFPVGDESSGIYVVNGLSFKIIHEYAGDLQGSMTVPDGSQTIGLWSLGNPSGCSTADYDTAFSDTASLGPLTLATENNAGQCDLGADTRAGDASGSSPFVFTPDVITANPAITGTRQPIDPLALAIGQAPDGVWTINTVDAFSQDVGSIREACLDIDYASVTYDIWVSTASSTCNDQLDTLTVNDGDTVFVCYEVSNQGTEGFDLVTGTTGFATDNVNNHSADLSLLNGTYQAKGTSVDARTRIISYTAGSSPIPVGTSTLTGEVSVRGFIGGINFDESDILITDETINVTVQDVVAPIVQTTSAPTANSSNQGSYPVSGTCTAGDNNVTVSIAGVAPSQSVACTAGGTWSATFDVSGIADGTAVIDISASQTDAAGNTGNAPLFEADKEIIVPVVQTTSAPTANSSNQSSYPVSGTCTAGDNNVTVSIAGVTPSQSVACTAGGTWSATFDVSGIADGTAVIDISASQTDIAGNTGNATLFEADKDAENPVTPIVDSQTTSDSTPVITGNAIVATGETLTVAVGGATYTVVPDGVGNWSLNTETAIPTSGTFIPDINGSNDVTAVITDAAGNSSTDITSGELTIDTLIAANDSGSGNGTLGGIAVANVLSNDLLAGVSANIADVNLTQLSTSHPNISLNTLSGSVAVAAGTPAGSYTLEYEVCEKAIPANCETATVSITVGNDTDQDGITDDIDLDDDNDGIPDTVEMLAAGPGGDTDGDGIPDERDLDSDGDGISDLQESGLSATQIAALDTDNDGTIDGAVGANGLADSIETNDTASAELDQNSDGTADSPADTDGDGQPDFQDLDADNDGIHDLVEGSGLDPAVADSNNDGIVDDNGTDSDGDGIPDSIDNNDSLPGGIASVPADTDGDGVANFRDLDSDNDGIHDLTEGGAVDPVTADTNNDGVLDNPLVDTDNDGIPDSGDSNAGVYGDPQGVGPAIADTDNDSIPDYRDLDSDNDSINDIDESGNSAADSNGDGIADAPTVDTDGDGVPDSVDDAVSVFGDPDVSALPDADGDNIPDAQDTDSNNDGTPDIVDNGQGSLDSDGDGVIDDNTDTDGDGIPDVTDGNDDGFGSPGTGPTLVFTGPTSTGTGIGTASIDNGGGPNCGFDLANTAFVSIDSLAVGTPTTNDFVHGLFNFRLTQCAPGAVVEITVRWPGSAFPTATEFWKYGPASAGASDSWFQPSSAFIDFSTNGTTYSVTNNGEGDMDGDVNTIIDPFGLAIPGSGVAPPPPAIPIKPIPTLSEWGRIILMLLIGVITLMQQGRRRKEVVRF